LGTGASSHCRQKCTARLYCLQDDSKLYKNNEISNLIVGLGLGLKGEDLGSLRYGKVRGVGTRGE
jgi:hypothetical protein